MLCTSILHQTQATCVLLANIRILCPNIYLADECKYGCVLCPFSSPPILLQMSTCRFGVHQRRLIVDLSSPTGQSVNDAIIAHSVTSQQHCCSYPATGSEYLSVENRCLQVIPVHPHDRHLLGMQWQDCCYVDTNLPDMHPLLFWQWPTHYNGEGHQPHLPLHG